MRFFLRFSSLAAMLASFVYGQQTGVTGRVTDGTGAVLVNARVVATESGGAKTATATNEQGIYQFAAIRAADYRLRFEAPGFTPAEKTLSLLVGQELTVDVTLRPAATTSTVDVLGGADQIEASSSQIGGNINPTQVSTLPLNGRNWMELTLLSPGVARNDVGFSPLGGDNSGKFQINVDGQQVTQNTADQSFGQPQYSRDAMDQFQIITNRFDATLGRSAQIQKIGRAHV